MKEITASALAAVLADLITNDADDAGVNDEGGYSGVFAQQRVETFKSAGVLTRDEGLRVKLTDGQVAYITVQIQAR